MVVQDKPVAQRYIEHPLVDRALHLAACDVEINGNGGVNGAYAGTIIDIGMGGNPVSQEIFPSRGIAERFDTDVSMLVDDAGDPGLRSLEVMAAEAIRRSWQGRVLAHHARAQAMYPKPYLQKLAALMKQARMGLVTDPHTGPLHARVKELLSEGVLVCLGQDDISDAYYPFGRNNLLEVAFLASHLLWMTTAAEMETLYDMITVKAFEAIGLQGYEVKGGAPANLVVLGQDNLVDALRYHEAPVYVISHGKLVDADKMRRMAGLID